MLQLNLLMSWLMHRLIPCLVQLGLSLILVLYKPYYLHIGSSHCDCLSPKPVIIVCRMPSRFHIEKEASISQSTCGHRELTLHV